LAGNPEDGLLGKGDIRFGYVYDEKSNYSFPAAFLTTNQTKPFVKIRKNGSTYLYKQIGKVSRSKQDASTGKTISTYPFYIYTMVQKAGVRIKRMSMFELYVDDNTPSIYQENVLPKQAAEDVVREQVDA
jgi:hypothetical protein